MIFLPLSAFIYYLKVKVYCVIISFMKNKIKTISKASIGFIAAQFVVMSIGLSHQIDKSRDYRYDASLEAINNSVFQNTRNPAGNEPMEFNVHFIAGATIGTR